VTLGVMLMLAGMVVYSTSGIGDWKLGRDASLELQRVYLAQKSFLADHPTHSVDTITESELVPYLQGLTALPVVESLEGSTLTIDVTQMPPVCSAGGGSAYDPSDSNEDGLWDVGRH